MVTIGVNLIVIQVWFEWARNFHKLQVFFEMEKNSTLSSEMVIKMEPDALSTICDSTVSDFTWRYEQFDETLLKIGLVKFVLDLAKNQLKISGKSCKSRLQMKISKKIQTVQIEYWSLDPIPIHKL